MSRDVRVDMFAQVKTCRHSTRAGIGTVVRYCGNARKVREPDRDLRRGRLQVSSPGKCGFAIHAVEGLDDSAAKRRGIRFFHWHHIPDYEGSGKVFITGSRSFFYLLAVRVDTRFGLLASLQIRQPLWIRGR